MKIMGIINVLPVEISNKIAAGEVVERPASVVKELVENSIDAGASVISVEIRKGGITYIRVDDDGKGMERADAETAFLRHATSKIRTENDLDAIYTLGFRGEALSSIGAVAQVELYTKRREDSEGTLVSCTGGEIRTSSEVGTKDGTTFIVRNLFFNTPARMNFLKRDATEASYVTDIMERFILSHPEIAFRYTIDGKDRYFTSGDNSLINCIYAVYGKSYAKSVIPVDYESEHLKITGMIGKGDASRPNRGYQSFFVNKRYVKSMRISAAVENAYKNQIMIGKHPMAVLNIEINPKYIDINVHPTKLEVKFSHEEEVFHALYHSVQNALYAIPNVPQLERTPPVRSEFQRDSANTSMQQEIAAQAPSVPPALDFSAASVHESFREEEAPKPVKKPVPQTAPLPEEDKSSYALDASNEYFIRKQKEISASYSGEEEAPQQQVAESVSTILMKHVLSGIGSSGPSIISEPVLQKPAEAEGWGFDRSCLRIIGQVFRTYILAEAGDTMIIADQHAAHERLKYEELKRELAARNVTSQLLLLPVSVDLSPKEFAAYTENASALNDMGFETEEFGSSSILIRATPEALEENELKNLVIELLDQFAEGRQEVISEKMERALYTIACKAAVKANHKFDTKQLESLLNAVLDLENINTCPHGRPIIVTMSKKEMEKEFKRIL